MCPEQTTNYMVKGRVMYKSGLFVIMYKSDIFVQKFG